MKTKTRIAMAFLAASLITVFLFSGFVYYFITRYSFTDFYKRLEIRAVFIAKSKLDEPGTKETFSKTREEHLEKLPNERDYIFKITDTSNFEQESAQLGVPVSFFTDVIKKAKATGNHGNIFYSGIRYETGGEKYIVVVSAENYYNTHHLEYLRNIFLVGLIFSSLLTIYISFFFSRRVFTPVRSINEKMKNIGSENLHLRLEPTGVNDEINELQVTFNHMLDRLETAFETQNNFISNASHELRNPLTAIIGETDVALSKTREPAEYIESLRLVQHEAERLEKITRSLLFLAQTGFKKQEQEMKLVRMDQLLWDVKENVERVNPGNKVHLNLSLIPENPYNLKMKCNEQLLHLAINNIVSNGCKYSLRKPVTVSIGTTDEKIVIVIRDEGIGIPEKELKYIYDPFFRASNTRNFEGYGIGLPLARNIIRMHKGEIDVSSIEGKGTTVQLTFYRN